MQYIEFKALPENKICKMLTSNKKLDIIYAIFSVCKHAINYELALQAIRKYFSAQDIYIKTACLEATIFIPEVYGKMDLTLLEKILNDVFFKKDSCLMSIAEEVLQDYLRLFPEHKNWFFKSIPHSKKYNKPDLHFKLAQNLNRQFCCRDMQKAIQEEKIVEYDPLVRDYIINISAHRVKQLYFCSWCGIKLPNTLNKEYFDALEEDYGIKLEAADLTNFTNIPEEFKTDEWWKKRGL